MILSARVIRALTYGTIVFLSVAIGLSLYWSYALLLTGGPDEGLLLTKSKAVLESIYRPAFYIHALTGSVVLISGATQLSTTLRLRLPRLHRRLGRTYSAVVLLFTAPSGFVMAFYANGGIVAKCGFALLAMLWLMCTWKGVHFAMSGDVSAHRKYMLRSFTLTFSAVTLRLYLLFFALAGYRGDFTYAVVAWLCWVPSLLVIELWIRRGTVTGKTVQ